MKSSIYNSEFFKTPKGEVMVKEQDLPVRVLTMKDGVMIDAIFDRIQSNYQQAFAALDKLYSKSRLNKPYHKFQVVHRFIRCNFGEYDNRLDIDAMGEFCFEEVKCPLRGECKLEGVVCLPKADLALTPRERNVLELIAHGLSYIEVANALYISIHTVKRHTESIRKKLQLHSLQDLITFYNRKVQYR